MSKYTTEIRFICESLNENKPGGYASVDENIKAAIPHIFSFDFPIFDESYRDVLCAKILRHYYTREIGEETFGLWKLRLETKLNEIMPYYNTLYTSWRDNLVNLWGTKQTTEYTGNKKGNEAEDEVTGEKKKASSDEGEDITRNANDTILSTVHQETDAMKDQQEHATENEDKLSTDKYSDTPQGGIDGVISDDYLTNARMIDDVGIRKSAGEMVITDKGTSDSDTKYNDSKHETENRGVSRTDSHEIDGTKNRKVDSVSSEDYIIKVSGLVGTDVGKNLALLKETLLNIDMLIISDLEVLFMNIW